MRYIFLILLTAFSQFSFSTEPQVTVSLSDEAPLVGQVTFVKIKVLVPTWFAKPLYFDEIDTVNIINIKSNKSTYPTSERIGGETWTGVIKEYPLVAMTDGRYELTLPTLHINYTDQQGKAISRAITPKKVSFNAQLPATAKTLKPLIIANDITLKEDVNLSEPLEVGQSITRKITATIEGSSSLFIPTMMTTSNTEQQQSYPVTTNNIDSLNERTSVLTGNREEQQDIIVKQAGSFSLPKVAISYYQPSSDSIQTVEIEGSEVAVSAVNSTLKTWLLRFVMLVTLIVICFITYRVSRYLLHCYKLSEYAQFKKLLKAPYVTKNQYRAFLDWQTRWQAVLVNDKTTAMHAHEITQIYEKSLYAGAEKPSDFRQQLSLFRMSLLKQKHAKYTKLKPLNP